MSLPTPIYKLNAAQQQSVYEPAEDTFLLLDAIEKDIQKLRDISPEIVLEIGCGSGVVSTFVNQALGGNVTSLATDYNPDALDCTVETGRLNGVKIEVVRTDLDNGLSHLENKVDILLFNPPYVPTEDNPKNDLERCWAGGPNGRGAVDRLLPRVSKLLSGKGVFYLVALHSNNIPALLTACPDLVGSVAMERRCGIEHLYILKYTRKQA
ncbi:putative methylase [Ancylostoma caninum]|uniref:Methyltransferase HEMK2 n=1 Tax=Ancylostoma caninum TaxID=29170 RepID=A0A368G1J6_ANCCA|nr:putative methylase [Ancylostoma caninum]